MRINGLLLAALVAACGLVVLLGIQNKRLLSEQEAIYARSLKPAVGSWIPELPQRAIDDTPVKLGAPGRPQVIYFFDTACQFCKASSASIRRMAERTPLAVEVVGVGSGSNLGAYVSENQFAFPVVRQSRRTTHLFDVKQVPLLIATGHDGQVIYSHVGVLGIREEELLMAAFRSMDGRIATQ